VAINELLTCDGCKQQIDPATATVREVASWLFLDCPECRRQSDVTFRVTAPAFA
jgi:hypothetical protein